MTRKKPKPRQRAALNGNALFLSDPAFVAASDALTTLLAGILFDLYLGRNPNGNRQSEASA